MPAEEALSLGVFEQPSLSIEHLVAEQIEQLLDPTLDDEAIELLMAWFQRRLQADDPAAAAALEAAVLTTGSAIALETLTAARAPSCVEQAYRAVRAGLESGDSGTRFAAVAGIADLPLRKQRELAAPLAKLGGESEPDTDIRRAAGHLLRLIGERDARD